METPSTGTPIQLSDRYQARLNAYGLHISGIISGISLTNAETLQLLEYLLPYRQELVLAVHGTETHSEQSKAYRSHKGENE